MMTSLDDRDAAGWATYARRSVCDQHPSLWIDQDYLVLPLVDEHDDPNTAASCTYSGQPFASALGPRCPMCGWTMTADGGQPVQLFVPLALDQSVPVTRSPIQRLEHERTGTVITQIVTDQWGHTAAVVTNPRHPDVFLGPSQNAARDLIRRLTSHLPILIAGKLLGADSPHREYEDWMLASWASIATHEALREAAGDHILRPAWTIEGHEPTGWGSML